MSNRGSKSKGDAMYTLAKRAIVTGLLLTILAPNSLAQKYYPSQDCNECGGPEITQAMMRSTGYASNNCQGGEWLPSVPGSSMSSNGVSFQESVTWSSCNDGNGEHFFPADARIETGGGGGGTTSSDQYDLWVSANGPIRFTNYGTASNPELRPPTGSPLTMNPPSGSPPTSTITISDNAGTSWDFKKFASDGNDNIWWLVEKRNEQGQAWEFARDPQAKLLSAANGSYFVSYEYNGDNQIIESQAKVSGSLTAFTSFLFTGDYSGTLSGDVSQNDTDLIRVRHSTKTTSGTYSHRETHMRYSGDRPKALYTPASLVDLVKSGTASSYDNVFSKIDDVVQQYAEERVTYHTPASINDTDEFVNAYDLFAYPEGSSITVGGDGPNNGDLPVECLIKSLYSRGGAAGCCGGSGIHMEYSYLENDGDTPRVLIEVTRDSNETEVRRQVVGLSDEGWRVTSTTIANGTYWSEASDVDDDGYIVEYRSPAVHTQLQSDESVGNLLDDPLGGDDDNTTARIDIFEYDNDTKDRTWVAISKGTGTVQDVAEFEYDDFSRVTRSWRYTTPTDSQITQYDYTPRNPSDASDTRAKSVMTTLPIVSSSFPDQNGSGVATRTYRYFDELGRLRWTKDGEGYINYYSYHPIHNTLAYMVEDANPNSLPSSANSNTTKWDSATKWGASSAGARPARSSTLPTAMQLVTQTEFDPQGRTKKQIDPRGREHYTIYKVNQTLHFPFWSSNAAERGHIQVSKFDDADRETEAITANPAYAYPGSIPTGFYDYRSIYLTRSITLYDHSIGKMNESRSYHNVFPYSDGSLGTSFDSTKYFYDNEGRQHQTVSYVDTNRWQWSEQVYDGLGRSVATNKGVGSSSVSAPTMARTSRTVYDNGGVGDGYVTHQIQYYSSTSQETKNYGTRMHYDYRGRLRGSHPIHNVSDNLASETASAPYRIQDLNWEGQVIRTGVYNSDFSGTWSSIVDTDNYVSSSDGNIERYSTTDYDDLGRAYRTKQYNGDTNHLRIDRYYDRNNRVVAIAPAYAAATEMAYDGAGRQYQTRTATSLNTSKYASGRFNYRLPLPKPIIEDNENTGYSSSSTNKLSGGNGSVLEISHQVFDLAGNSIESHQFEINHTDTNGINIDGSDYVRRTVHNWYDGANRLTHSADYGSGAIHWRHSTPPTRTSAPPTASSSSLLLTKYTHGYAFAVGATKTDQVSTMTDPKGMVTKTWYDDLGRTRFVASSWNDANVGSSNYGAGSYYATGTGDSSDKSRDATVETTYNGLGAVKELRALDQNGNGNQSDNEVTKYYYQDGYDASRMTHTVYPDSISVWNSGDDIVTIAYNLDGTVHERKDQRGTKLEYAYDAKRREMIAEKVTSLGGADDYVRAIGRTYTDLGEIEKITSYSNVNMSPNSERNEIWYQRDGLGKITRSYQDHNGAWAGNTPRVTYYRSHSVDSSKAYRQQHRHYATQNPSGKLVFNRFGNTVDIALNRVTSIESYLDGTRRDVNYKYNGTSRLVETSYILTSPTSNPDDIVSSMDTGAGAGYEGWDRFGRTQTKQWLQGASAIRDKYTYGYDYASNRSSRTNNHPSSSSGAFSQGYTYDDGHRLESYTEGGTTTEQSWTLDAWGNWDQYRYNNNGTIQNRDHNEANEIDLISGSGSANWAEPVHDAAGNMTSVPDPNNLGSSLALRYDAWNRLVQAGTAVYRYDGLHRRIEKDLTGALNDEHYFYNEDWQCVEVRKSSETGAAKESYVWHPNYIDALAIRYWDSNGYNGYNDTNEVQYALQDANFNVTALTNSSGNVIERYHYSAYGELSVLDPGWGQDANGASDFGNSYTFTCRRVDTETGMYHYRNRSYHVQLGRFVNRDPVEYQGGQWNIYAYLAANPVASLDPLGLYNPLTGEGFPHQIESPHKNTDDDDSKLLDTLIWVLEQEPKAKCMTMCLVLDMTERDIQKLMEDIKNDLPATIRSQFIKELYSRPGDASAAFLTMLKVLRSRVMIVQGEGFIGDPLRKILGKHMVNVRRKIMRRISRRTGGRAGNRILGKIGSKVVPVAGWVSLGFTACNVARCTKACEDNRYRWDESLFETQVGVFESIIRTIEGHGQHSRPTF